MKILSADIGGTNSRFACFIVQEDRLEMHSSVWLDTHGATSFAHLLEQLWDSEFAFAPDSFAAVSIAVAGAVNKGVESDCLPNAPWGVDLRELDYGWPRACLVNDFAAQAYACRTDVMNGAMVLQDGDADNESVIGVIGAGTGLGYSALLPCAGTWTALPSEGGHMAFPFVGKQEADYGEFNRLESGRKWAEGDTVVTGLGLQLLHKYFTGEELAPSAIAASLTSDSDTTQWYARFYGRVCRDWALALMCRGGLYISGGVAAKNPLLVQSPAFLEEFHNTHVYEDFLRSIPIKVNANEASGLYGAAFCGLQLLKG